MTTAQAKHGLFQPTQTVEFDDGEYWVIYNEPTRGQRKKLRAANLRAFHLPEGVDIDRTDPQAMQAYLFNHPEYLDLDAADDALLLVGTANWSFDLPISPESFDRLPDKYVNPVLTLLRKYFEEVTEENLMNGVRT